MTVGESASVSSAFELEETSDDRQLLFEKVNNFSEHFLSTLNNQKAFQNNSHKVNENDLFTLLQLLINYVLIF